MNEMPGLKSGAGQFVNAIIFCIDCGEFGCSEIASRVSNVGDPGVLDRQTSGRDQSGQLRITKFVQQSPDVSINGLGPDLLARVEVAAYESGVDAGIDGGSVKRYEAPLRVAGHANFAPAAVLVLEPVHGSEHLLHLVADDVTPHVKRLTVDPFAVRLGRHADIRMTRPPGTTVD